jgi:hypothetical protein
MERFSTMDDTYRSTVGVVALAVLLVAAGCGQVIGGGPAGPQYQGDASDYLLTAGEVGDSWTENVTRDPNINSSRIESGRVIELTNGSADLQITVLVFSSAADSGAFLDEQRQAYDSSGLNATNVSLGDEGIGATVSTGTFLEARTDNVYVQVIGNVQPETAEGYVRAQFEKLRVAGESDE